ncbi:DNA-binding TFAR19-related protein [Basidiobolus meristosporus CBS 931.73]|uniref:DNA-binding TFAR19-related protein n=1 Tax=Basidiobolus meristosporus CBS 931.73 TaxID=1314790 RepID=A0A1Y1Y0J2_9FUNG|nr:DNA-binding TFAR19-related protein [Basidiobolus meristosporus CBS 931.73]|eukprot:ORX91520.1 DNA-binding TFAR19-related protein [Basidiobolus meristosporus CBS 931.73]
MEDSELEAIRARRLAELRARQGGGGSSMGGGSMGMSKGDDEGKNEQQEELRRSMLAQILDNQARERIARISIVKADKARAVEDLLIRMAQTGQLRGKVTESHLIELLEQINSQQKAETKIVYNRRRFDDDSDDEFDL